MLSRIPTAALAFVNGGVDPMPTTEPVSLPGLGDSGLSEATRVIERHEVGGNQGG